MPRLIRRCRTGALLTVLQSSFLHAACRHSLVEGPRIGYVCFLEHSGLDERLATHLETTMQDHRAMFDAVVACDPDATEQPASAHVELVRNRVAATILSTDMTRQIPAASRQS